MPSDPENPLTEGKPVKVPLSDNGEGIPGTIGELLEIPEAA